MRGGGPGHGQAWAGPAVPHGARRRAEEGVRQIQWVGCAGPVGMFGTVP